MAVTMSWYAQAMAKAFNKEIDFDTDVLKVAIIGSGYTPDLENHDYFDDVSTNQVTGAGYTAGGNVLTTVSWNFVTATDRWRLTAANSAWGTVAFTNGRYGVLYDDSPALASAKPLIGMCNFGANYSPAGENFTLDWDDTLGLLGIALTLV